MGIKKPKIYIIDRFYYSEYDYFYMDIIKNKNLSPLVFFNYIYKKYGSFNNIETLLNKMQENGNIFMCSNIKIIFDYKEACLQNNKDKINELKEKYNSISNKFNFIPPTKSPVDVAQKNGNGCLKPIDIINRVDEYLDSDQHYSYSKVEQIKKHMIAHRKNIDMNKYVDIIIKYSNINKISQRELDELMEILNYFLYHLNCTLEKLQDYKNNISSINKKINDCKKNIHFFEISKNQTNKLQLLKDEYRELEKLLAMYRKKLNSIYIEGEENLDQKKYGYNIVLCNWKISKVKGSMKIYNRVLEYMVNFSDALKYNKDKLIEIRPLISNIDEDYLIDIVKHIRNIILGYKQIPVDLLTEEISEKMKTYYIEKLYQN